MLYIQFSAARRRQSGQRRIWFRKRFSPASAAGGWNEILFGRFQVPPCRLPHPRAGDPHRSAIHPNSLSRLSRFVIAIVAVVVGTAVELCYVQVRAPNVRGEQAFLTLRTSATILAAAAHSKRSAQRTSRSHK